MIHWASQCRISIKDRQSRRHILNATQKIENTSGTTCQFRKKKAFRGNVLIDRNPLLVAQLSWGSPSGDLMHRQLFLKLDGSVPLGFQIWPMFIRFSPCHSISHFSALQLVQFSTLWLLPGFQFHICNSLYIRVFAKSICKEYLQRVFEKGIWKSISLPLGIKW